jgi:hypothetical protein
MVVRVLLLFRFESPISKKHNTVTVGVKQFDPEEEGATILRSRDTASYLGRPEVSNPLVLKTVV